MNLITAPAAFPSGANIPAAVARTLPGMALVGEIGRAHV